MKPDWKDAPTWANWLCMDEDGTWYWFENKPVSVTRAGDGVWKRGPEQGRCIPAWIAPLPWDATLEERP